MSADEIAQLREAANRRKEAQLHAGKQNLGTGSLFGRPTALQLLGALAGEDDKDEGDDKEDQPIDPSDPHTVPDGDTDDDEESSTVSTLFLPPDSNGWQKSFMGGGVMNNSKLRAIPGMQTQTKITSGAPTETHVVNTIGSVSFFNKREQALTPKLDLLIMSDGGHVVKTEKGDHMPYNAWLENERARQRDPPPDTGNERWDNWKDAPGFRKFQDLVAATQAEDPAEEVDEEDPPPPYHEEAEDEAPPAYNGDDGHDGDDDEGDEGDGQAEFV